MGYRNDIFYRIKELYDTCGDKDLREVSRRKPIPKNRVEPAIEEQRIRWLSINLHSGKSGSVMNFVRKVFSRDLPFC